MTTGKPELNYADADSPISRLTWAMYNQLMDNIISQVDKLPEEAVYTYQVATMTSLVQAVAMLSTMHFGVEQVEDIRPKLHQQLDNYLTWARDDCLAQVRRNAN